MEIFRGISVSPGVAIGEAVVLEAEEYRIPYRVVPASDAPQELERFLAAVQSSVSEIEEQSTHLHAHLGRDAANVFDWHVGVLKDESLRDQISKLIQEKNAAAAYAVSTVMRSYQRRFM